MADELDSSGSVTGDYTQGLGIDEPLAMYRGLTTACFQADGLGSITSLTDGAGQVAASYVYDSFGKLTASTGTVTNPFQYAGREFDSETGLYYYRARYYNPVSGRFLNEDPIGFKGADPNLYRYVRNMPTIFIDPFGLLTVDPAFPSSCLPSLDRALNIVQGVALTNKKCNCFFLNLNGHRSLLDMVDDPGITIKYDSQEGTGKDANQTAYTWSNDPFTIYFRPLGCRLGRWQLAAKIIHELTHTTQKPTANEQQKDENEAEAQEAENEAEAQEAEIECGFPRRSLPQVITVTP